MLDGERLLQQPASGVRVTSRSSTWPNTPASSVRRKTKSVRRDAARRGACERANVLGYSLVRMGKLSRGVQTIVSPILKIEIGSAMGKGFAPNQRQSLFGKSCEDADDGENNEDSDAKNRLPDELISLPLGYRGHEIPTDVVVYNIQAAQTTQHRHQQANKNFALYPPLISRNLIVPTKRTAVTLSEFAAGPCFVPFARFASNKCKGTPAPERRSFAHNEKPIVWGRSFMPARVLSVVRILDEWQADFAEALAPLSAILGGCLATPASWESLDSLLRSRTPL